MATHPQDASQVTSIELRKRDRVHWSDSSWPNRTNSDYHGRWTPLITLVTVVEDSATQVYITDGSRVRCPPREAPRKVHSINLDQAYSATHQRYLCRGENFVGPLCLSAKSQILYRILCRRVIRFERDRPCGRFPLCIDSELPSDFTVVVVI